MFLWLLWNSNFINTYVRIIFCSFFRWDFSRCKFTPQSQASHWVIKTKQMKLVLAFVKSFIHQSILMMYLNSISIAYMKLNDKNVNYCIRIIRLNTIWINVNILFKYWIPIHKNLNHIKLFYIWLFTSVLVFTLENRDSNKRVGATVWGNRVHLITQRLSHEFSLTLTPTHMYKNLNFLLTLFICVTTLL